jgi:hypothetical protein
MAWSATLTSITKNAATKQITLVVTIQGGTEPYILEIVQGFNDLRMSNTQLLMEVRNFIAKMKEVESVYAQLKAFEGAEIPLGLG